MEIIKTLSIPEILGIVLTDLIIIFGFVVFVVAIWKGNKNEDDINGED